MNFGRAGVYCTKSTQFPFIVPVSLLASMVGCKKYQNLLASFSFTRKYLFHFQGFTCSLSNEEGACRSKGVGFKIEGQYRKRHFEFVEWGRDTHFFLMRNKLSCFSLDVS